MLEASTLKEYETHLFQLSQECKQLQSELHRQSAIYKTTLQHLQSLQNQCKDNANLKDQIQSLCIQRDELQLLLRKRINYNSLSQGIDSVVRKEVEFCNKWNKKITQNIQLKTNCIYQQIEQTKHLIEKLSQQNIVLKKNILQCTAHYQQKIFSLEQKIAQKHLLVQYEKQQKTIQQCKLNEQNTVDNIEMIMLKIANNTILQLKKQISNLLKQCQALTKQLQYRMRPQQKKYQFTSISQIAQILTENTELKKQISIMDQKLILFSKDEQRVNYYPNKYQFVKLKSQNKQLLRELHQLKNQQQKLKLELTNRQIKEKQFLKNVQNQKQLHKKVIKKCLRAFQKMNPYFDLNQYQQIGLNEEQMNYAMNKKQPKTINIRAEVQALLSKIAQNKDKIRILQESNKKITNENNQLFLSNEKLLSAMDVVMKKQKSQSYNYEIIIKCYRQTLLKNEQLSRKIYQKDTKLALLQCKIRHFQQNNCSNVLSICLQTPSLTSIQTTNLDQMQIKTTNNVQWEYQFSMLKSQLKQLYNQKLQMKRNLQGQLYEWQRKYDTLLQKHNELINNRQVPRQQQQIPQAIQSNNIVHAIQSTTNLTQEQPLLNESTQQLIEQLLSKHDKQMKRLLVLYQSLSNNVRWQKPQYTPLIQYHPPDHVYLVQQLKIAEGIILQQKRKQTQQINKIQTQLTQVVQHRNKIEAQLKSIKEKIIIQGNVSQSQLVETMLQMIKNRDRRIEQLENNRVEQQQQKLQQQQPLDNAQIKEIRECIQMGLVDVLQQALSRIESEEY